MVNQYDNHNLVWLTMMKVNDAHLGMPPMYHNQANHGNHWTRLTMIARPNMVNHGPWCHNHVNHDHGMKTRSTISMVSQASQSWYGITMGKHANHSLHYLSYILVKQPNQPW